ncbi:hypothetical protein SCA6_003625 [Theobroma cacao]
MEDSGAILYQISCLKDMLDQVNEEIEANIQITRELESEIVKLTEIEAALAIRESQLVKSLYISHFEVDGLLSVTADSRNSLKLLEEELTCLRAKRDEMLKRMENKRLSTCYPGIYEGTTSTSLAIGLPKEALSEFNHSGLLEPAVYDRLIDETEKKGLVERLASQSLTSRVVVSII